MWNLLAHLEKQPQKDTATNNHFRIPVKCRFLSQTQSREGIFVEWLNKHRFGGISIFPSSWEGGGKAGRWCVLADTPPCWRWLLGTTFSVLLAPPMTCRAVMCIRSLSPTTEVLNFNSLHPTNYQGLSTKGTGLLPVLQWFFSVEFNFLLLIVIQKYGWHKKYIFLIGKEALKHKIYLFNIKCLKESMWYDFYYTNNIYSKYSVAKKKQYLFVSFF